MEENENKPIVIRNGISSLIIQENITVLDLSHRNISDIRDIKLPVNLLELNLSHNKLIELPATVLCLEYLKVLDLSFNNIEYFDDAPYFCRKIEYLNIANNKLLGPPYWIWTEEAKNLREVDLSCNICITKSFVNGYYEELLQYRTLVSVIKINNCKLQNYLQLIETFSKAKVLELGTADISYHSSANFIEEVPCVGLDKCCDLENLNLSNTYLSTINPNIVMYKYLKQINLSQNKLSSLPEEFCHLESLEECILSFNNLLYLPEEFHKLNKLKVLLVDSNELCMVPEEICNLKYLNTLDVYDNYLYEIPKGIERLRAVDLAQNYFDEPDDEQYIVKRDQIRVKNVERYIGRRMEVERTESEYSKDVTDDELDWINETEEADIQNRPLSSPEEDWDSDEYWVPHASRHSSHPQSPWIFYVKRKMEEGNFCPMDVHPVSVMDTVKYEKLCNPKIVYESDGQFDDYSSDDS